MRTLLLLVAVLVPAGSLFAAPVPKAAKKTNYYPMEVGHTWVFEEDGDTRTTTVTAVKDDKGGRIFTVQYKGVKSQPSSLEREIRVEDGTVTSLRADDSVAEKPSVIMKTGLKAGDTWTTEHKWTDSAGFTITYKAGEAQTVKTPAGEFTAIPVDYESSSRKERRWYASGVGLVRKEQDGKLTAELKSFTPGGGGK